MVATAGIKRAINLAVWAVFIVFGVAGVAKLIALDRFQTHLDAWTLIPGWAAPVLAMGVPAVEASLAGLWFIGARRRRVAAATLVVALALGALSVAQYMIHPVPDCGCFGVLAKHARLEAGLPKLIGINAVSVAVLAAWLSATRPSTGRSAGDESARRRTPSGAERSRAFTLIETVLVIGIIALLVVLLLPSLGVVRQGAQDAVSLSNMRQHASVYSMYATDWDDYSPYPVDPGATLNVFRGGGVVVEAEYFDVTELWQVALADAYYDGAVFSHSLSHPADRLRGTWITYRMTSSYLAHPNYWVNRPDRDVSLWGGVRVTQTRYPADKAWLIEFNPLHDFLIPVGLGAVGASRKGVGLAFVDGHAERLDGPELTTPLYHGDGIVDQGFRRLGIFGMHTPDGAFGRDKR
jgi:type II secretory pathway pseudopilin PulG